MSKLKSFTGSFGAVFPKIPEIRATPQFGPERISGGFIWAVQFRLPLPAAENGIIVQEVVQFQSGTNSVGNAFSLTTHYWEAWEVTKGSHAPNSNGESTVGQFIAGLGVTPPSDPKFNQRFNDIFFKQFSIGNKGSVIYLSSAAFYQRALPSDFVVNNPATGAGSLPSTLTRPGFWLGLGVFRALKFDFDFSSSRSKSNATLKTVIEPVGTVFATNPDASSYASH
jgi:hypothetical protein